MDHQFQRQSNLAAAMQARTGSQRAAMPPSDMRMSSLKRSQTSLPAGSTHMHPSYSTHSGPPPGMPLAYSFDTALFGSVTEQQLGNASVPFPRLQVAAAAPASYLPAGHFGAPVGEDYGMEPNAYLQAKGLNPSRPLPVSFAGSSPLPSATLAFGNPDRLQRHLNAPSLSSFDSMTEAMTLETDSSGHARDPYDGSPAHSFQMLHSSSQSSFMESPIYGGGVNLFDKSSANDTDLRYTGCMMYGNNLAPAAPTGMVADVPRIMPHMERSMSAQSFATVDLAMPTVSAMPHPFVGNLAQQQPTAADMRRDLSNTSTRSTSSRAMESLIRHLDNGKTPLKPKASSDDVENPSGSQLPSSFANMLPDPTRREVHKTRQEQRPKTSKLTCELCPTSKSFRGDHELRRHLLNKHSDSPKRWICCDPSEVGKTASLVPYQSLADCRRCREKKKYPQYYNAAEHLRRVHFTPKSQRKGSKTTSGRPKKGSHGYHTDSQRRTEDEHVVPMEEMKKWMKAVAEPADEGDSEHHKLGTPDDAGFNGSAASHGQGNLDSPGYSNGSDTSNGCCMFPPGSACQSPKVAPWLPKDFAEETSGMFANYDVHSPSHMQGRDDILGCDDDLASPSPAFPDDINPSYYFSGFS